MSDLEAGGALITAGLIAHEIDGDDVKQHKHGAHQSNCANCGSLLSGDFCSACGQSAHIHRSLLHLIEEVLHGIWHFDAKGWKTIPLLVFFPGRLTRRYIDGQRKNYVSPLALFLFMMFFSFFVASLGNDKPVENSLKPEAVVEQQAAVAKYAKDLDAAKAGLTRAQQALDAGRTKGGDIEGLKDALSEAREQVDDVQGRLSQALIEQTVAQSAGTAKSQVVAAKGEKNTVNTLTTVVTKIKEKSGLYSSNPAIERWVEHVLANPELTIYKLKNAAYKYAFMLVPISLPFFWLMFFWKRNVVMFDHAVFVLYSLCFMSLLFSMIVLLDMIGWTTPIGFLVVFAPPLHMFVQLRGTYNLGMFSALWRTLVLLNVATIALIVFSIFVLAITVH